MTEDRGEATARRAMMGAEQLSAAARAIPVTKEQYDAFVKSRLTMNEIIGINANKEATMKKEECADCETYDSGTPTECPGEIEIVLEGIEKAVSRMGDVILSLERRLSPVLVKAETKTDQVVPCAGTTPLGWRLSNIGNYLERIIENISDLNMRCEL